VKMGEEERERKIMHARSRTGAKRSFFASASGICWNTHAAQHASLIFASALGSCWHQSYPSSADTPTAPSSLTTAVPHVRCCGSYPRGRLVLELQQQGDRYVVHNLRDGEHHPVPGFLSSRPTASVRSA
jgi:hypothetical protein